MTILEQREDILRLIPKNSKIIEIGVFKGDFSKQIFQICEPSELNLIDIFAGRMGSGDKNGENFEFIQLEHYYEHLLNFFEKNTNVKLLKGLSDDVFKKLPDDHYDLIYIDASHEYDCVKKDLENSFNKIKNGGYITGHDYEIQRFPGVIKAVEEFCEKNNQSIEFLTKEKLPSFAIKIKK